MKRLTWDQYALELAVAAASRSEDPYHRVGAALLRHDNTVAALGYNGAPPGVEIDWTARDERRPYVLHAEANALRYVHPGEVALLAATMMPCWACVLAAASYGIRRIAYIAELDPSVYSREAILELAEACGIEIVCGRRPDDLPPRFVKESS